MASGWQAGSLTMCLAVKICPGSYSVSVLECADVGERKGREDWRVMVVGGGWADRPDCRGLSLPLVG